MENRDVEELQFFFFSPKTRQAVGDALKQFPELCGVYSGVYVEIFHRTASKSWASGKRRLPALATGRTTFPCFGRRDCALPWAMRWTP